MNKEIWGGDDNFSVRSDVGEANKLDTAVQRYSTNERNTASSQIEEEILESIFPKIIEESNSSKRMNLANYKAPIFWAPTHGDKQCRTPARWYRRYQNRRTKQDLEAHGQGRYYGAYA